MQGVEMGELTISEVAFSVRTVTDEDCAYYYEHGWTMLPGLISEEAAEKLLVEANRLMGSRATDTNTRNAGAGKRSKKDPPRAVYAFEGPSQSSDPFKGFFYSQRLGHIAARLMSNPLLGPRQARRFNDSILVKMPENEGGSGTHWHQDQTFFPLDRDGTVGIWTALVPMTPDMGTLRFIEGSHRLGCFGHFSGDSPVDPLETYRGLAEYCKDRVSPALELRAGDAIAYDALTLHSAGPNLSNRPRWAYWNSFFPAEALYTGYPYGVCDDLDLALNQPLDHPRFPIVDAPFVTGSI
jgi:hypothetical protein